MNFNDLSPLHKEFLKKQKRRKVVIHLLQIAFLAVFLGAWELATQVGWVDGFIFSSPSRVWNTFVNLFKEGNLFKHVWASTWETILGFAIGTILGMLIAIILWWSDTVKRVFEPYLVVLNSLPKIALGPLIIIWAGTGKSAIVTMAVLISVVITALNMLVGFCQTEQNKILLMQTFQANKAQIFFKLVFPANIPTLLATLKINVGMSWVGTITGEYLVSKEGLGYLIVYGSQVFRLDLVMTCTIVLCLLAGAMYGLVALLEKSVKFD